MLSMTAWAELTIFDVRKNIAMSDDEKVYRDFYINAGSEAGLATGQIITVQRRMPLYDSYQNRSAGDLDLKVAKIKIIHVQKGLAVARLFSEFTRDNAPLLEDPFIMVGDRLDLNSATSEKDAGKKASNDEPEKMEAPVAANKAEPKIIVNAVEIQPGETPKQNPPIPNSIDNPIAQ
jgi:hypothetical protein